MVYLIDDNINNLRLNNRKNYYHITYIEEGLFKDCLISEKTKKVSDTSHLEFLKEAECILLHRSTYDYDKITEIIANFGNNIPLTIFSNSYNGIYFDSYTPDKIMLRMNKNIFYCNLQDFLKDYRENNKINFKMLAFGKDFKIYDMMNHASNIFKHLPFTNDVLNISLLSPSIVDFKSLTDIALPDRNFDDILNIVLISNTKVRDFKKKINKLIYSIDKFGKDIYQTF